MWVSNKLPSDGRLAPLALKMINRIVEWIHTVNKHLDLEYTKLTQQHILEDDALILLSKELIIMFPRIQAVRMQRMEFCVSHTGVFGSHIRSTGSCKSSCRAGSITMWPL